MALIPGDDDGAKIDGQSHERGPEPPDRAAGTRAGHPTEEPFPRRPSSMTAICRSGMARTSRGSEPEGRSWLADQEARLAQGSRPRCCGSRPRETHRQCQEAQVHS